VHVQHKKAGVPRTIMPVNEAVRTFKQLITVFQIETLLVPECEIHDANGLHVCEVFTRLIGCQIVPQSALHPIAKTFKVSFAHLSRCPPTCNFFAFFRGLFCKHRIFLWCFLPAVMGQKPQHLSEITLIRQVCRELLGPGHLCLLQASIPPCSRRSKQSDGGRRCRRGKRSRPTATGPQQQVHSSRPTATGPQQQHRAHEILDQ